MDGSEFTTNFETAEDFIEYLSETLIPDMNDTETYEAAHDLTEAMYWINFYKAAFFTELENRHTFVKTVNNTFTELINEGGTDEG